jgi:hypothetical protein
VQPVGEPREEQDEERRGQEEHALGQKLDQYLQPLGQPVEEPEEVGVQEIDECLDPIAERDLVGFDDVREAIHRRGPPSCCATDRPAAGTDA